MTHRFTLLLGLLLVAPACPGQDLAELEVDHSLQTALVTPHTDWAVPWAQGKARVLFFVRGHDTEPREVVELQQRLDLDAQMVLWTRIIDYTTGWSRNCRSTRAGPRSAGRCREKSGSPERGTTANV